MPLGHVIQSTPRPLYASVETGQASTGLHFARIHAGPNVTLLAGYLSPTMAYAQAAHIALVVFGRVARPLN